LEPDGEAGNAIDLLDFALMRAELGDETREEMLE
jgi:hypothetical protein